MTDKTPVFIIDENMMATDEGADTAIKAFLGAAMSAGIDFHVHTSRESGENAAVGPQKKG